MPIEHVTDTALWVASHRAAESRRPDALFHDPLAEILAGERGREIAKSMPGGALMEWVMAIRTASIDRLVLDALQLGVDTVLNIGAGLDTRPYRMTLPETLRWIEVDFPSMIDYKTERLGDARPVCHLERIALDLTDAEQRRALLARVGSESKCVLVMTEGVLIYLAPEDVATLADEIHAVPQLRYWIQDYYNGLLRRTVPLSWEKKMRAAPIRFRVEDWFAYFAKHGWRVKKNLVLVEEARRLGRKFPMTFPRSLIMMVRFALMSKADREKAQRASGYALFEHVEIGQA